MKYHVSYKFAIKATGEIIEDEQDLETEDDMVSLVNNIIYGEDVQLLKLNIVTESK